MIRFKPATNAKIVIENIAKINQDLISDICAAKDSANEENDVAKGIERNDDLTIAQDAAVYLDGGSITKTLTHFANGNTPGIAPGPDAVSERQFTLSSSQLTEQAASQETSNQRAVTQSQRSHLTPQSTSSVQQAVSHSFISTESQCPQNALEDLVCETENSKTLLFFIHGVGGSAQIWRKQLQHFSGMNI